MPTFSSSNFLTIAPLLTIIITGMVVLMVDLWLPRDRKSPLVVLSTIGILVAAFFCAYLWTRNLTGFNGTVVADDFALVFQFILLVVAVLSIFLSERYIQHKGINYGEYYALYCSPHRARC